LGAQQNVKYRLGRLIREAYFLLNLPARHSIALSEELNARLEAPVRFNFKLLSLRLAPCDKEQTKTNCVENTCLNKMECNINGSILLDVVYV
jgi:hypothetical protein